MTQLIDETVLEMTRLFDAPPARVFDCWIDREAWQSWIGPEGVRCEVPLLEPRVGGAYRIIMRMSDGRTIPVAGVFRTIDAPRTLAFTWGWENDADRQSLITLTFDDRDGKTRFTLKQEGLGSVENRDGHHAGWTGALNKLARYLADGTA
jgi:uncharacterized protein YndB with AHSA1/START domain